MKKNRVTSRFVSIPLSVFIAVSILVPFSAHAVCPQTGTGSGAGSAVPSPCIENPLGAANTISAFVVKVLETVSTIGLIISPLFLIYVGYLFVSARGNETQIETARSALIWTVVGIGVLLGATLFSKVICGTINGLNDATHQISC